MTPEQRIAYIQAQIACAMIELEGMKAENAIAEYNHDLPPFDGASFKKLIEEYGISHNQVISFLQR
jgi:hypothetical protein